MRKTTNTLPVIRWQLLSTVSAVALVASAYGAGQAEAAGSDADRPLIWIELGGQAEFVSGQGEPFDPPFITANPNSSVLQKVTPLQAQQPLRFAFGEDAKISFQPDNSDWIFSAAIRYGRSSDHRHVDHQTNQKHYRFSKYGGPPTSHSRYRNYNPKLQTAAFADTHAERREDHAILDFMAGKDVGLGFLGSSTVNAGVRFAQFNSGSASDIRARPEVKDDSRYYAFAHATFNFLYCNGYHATGSATRGFHGVGPALSWSGSTPFVGSAEDGEISIDWGANAALLFGRQKAHVRHQETAYFITPSNGWNHIYQLYPPRSGGHDNVRSVTVPNIGGTLGISFRKGDAKVSFGYRTDVFFGAMDTGIDAAKKSNLTFNGPYASISIGLGD